LPKKENEKGMAYTDRADADNVRADVGRERRIKYCARVDGAKV